MSIVGTAEIVLRAITRNLHKDVKKGLDDAAKDVDASGAKAGENYGVNLWGSAEDEVKKSGHKVGDALSNAIEPDRRGNGIGKKFGKAVISGLGGALSGLASLTSMFALVTGLGGLIGGLVGAVGALAAGAVALTAALGPALAAMGAVGAAAVGGLVVGLLGAVAIFGTLSKKFTEITPEITAFKNQLTGIKDEFNKLRSEVASDLFAKIQKPVKDLANSAFPFLRQALEGVSTAIANTVIKFRDLFNQPAFKGALKSTLGSFTDLADSMGSGLADLASVFVHLIAAARPAITMFATWFKGWSSNLRTITEAGASTGKLGNFFSTAAAKGQQFFATLHNLWDVLRDIFRAASPLGSVFLDNFQKGTKALSDFTSSAQGAGKLFDFFKPGGQVNQNITAVWKLVKDLGSALGTLASNSGVAKLASGLSAVLPGVTAVVNSMVKAIGTVGEALGRSFQSPAGVAGIKALSTGVEAFGKAIAQLEPAVGPVLQIVGDLAKNLSNLLGPAFKTIGDILPRLVGPLDTIEKALGSVLLDAVKALAPVLVQVVQLIAELTKAFAGPLGTVIRTAATALTLLLNAASPLIHVLSALAPLIVTVGTAWLTWRTLSGIAPKIQQFGAGLTYVGTSGGVANKALGPLGKTVSGFGAALPVVGIAFALFSAGMAVSAETTQKWTDALNSGGKAADSARNEMDKQDAVVKKLTTGWMGWLGIINGTGGAVQAYAADAKNAKDANAEFEKGLSPLETAQRDLTAAQRDYNTVLNNTKSSRQDIQNALMNVATATATQQVATYNAARASGDYATATDLVANALWGEVDAQNAANGSLASSQLSAVGAARAAEALAEAQKSGDPLAIAQAQAQLNLQLDSAVTASQNAAKAFSESSDGIAKYGSATAAMHASFQGQIKDLDGLIAKTSGPAQQALIDLRGRLVDLDGQTAQPDVDVITDAAMAKVLGLDGELAKVAGTKVSAEVFAATEKADNNIQGTLTALAKVSGTRTEAQVTAATQDATASLNLVFGELFKLDNTSSTAEITAATDKANDSIQGIIYKLAGVNATTATPEVNALVTKAQTDLSGVVGQLIGLDTQTANPEVVVDTKKPKFDVAELVGDVLGLGKLRPTPVVSLNPAPFNAVHKNTSGLIEGLDKKRPTPVANMNNDPFNTKLTQALIGSGKLAGQRPAPVATLVDRVSGIALAAQRAIEKIRDKTVTITAIHRTINESVAGSSIKSTRASGGRINSSAWTTVGEEGRELVFLSQGQYVATYQKAQKILAAASMQASSIAAQRGGTTAVVPVPAAAQGNVTIPITVNPSAGMNETELARKTGREFAFQYRKLV